MRKILLCIHIIALFAVLNPSLVCGQAKKESTENQKSLHQKQSVSNQISKLISEIDEGTEKYTKLIPEILATEKDKRIAGKRINELLRILVENKIDQLVEMVEELHSRDPTNSEIVEGLIFLVQAKRDKNGSAMKALFDHHSHNPKLTRFVAFHSTLGRGDRSKSVLQKATTGNVSGDVKFVASFSPINKKLHTFDGSRKERRALGEVVKKFLLEAQSRGINDLIISRNRTLSEVVQAKLFDFTKLQVGEIVPEIEGEDLDGKRFKLSDYRGKVVLLTFWGDWCGACQRMYPHERRLIDRLRGKPFAIIGVNSDGDRESIKQIIKTKKIEWRSFWNGGSPAGPIASKWNINAWPTSFLIDSSGKIRFRDLRGSNLDEAIEKLLAESGTSVELKNKKPHAQ